MNLLRTSLRLLQVLWADNRKAVALRVFSSLTSGLLPLISIWAGARLIDVLATYQRQELDHEKVFLYATLAITCGVLSSASILADRFAWERLRALQTISLERFIVDLISRQGVARLEQKQFHDRVVLIRENTWRIGNFVDQVFLILGYLINFTVAALFVLGNFPWCGIVVICASIPRLAISRLQSKIVLDCEKRFAERRRHFWAVRYFLTNISPLRDVERLAKRSYFLKKFIKQLRFLEIGTFKVRGSTLKMEALVEALSQLIMAGIFFYLITLVVKGSLSVGEWSLYSGMLVRLNISTSTISGALSEQFQTLGFVVQAFSLADETAPVKSLEIVSSPHAAPTIQIRDLVFSYPGKAQSVLKIENLTIGAGEYVAIVGPIGSGKSTLVKLLTKTYLSPPHTILVQGRDLHAVDRDEYLAQVACLAQDFYTFDSLTLRENILMGCESIQTGEARLSRAMAQANSQLFQNELGLSKIIGPEFTRGIHLSGGQFQLLALTRTFAREASILILDEPCAHLDPQKEEEISHTISELNSMTRIVISHRYGSLRDAHRILVFSAGKIIEQGTHAELLALNGFYADQFRKQAKRYS
jgi:ATP-binding cassette, subfamily B, bacterial